MCVITLRRWVPLLFALITSAVLGCSSDVPARIEPTGEPQKIVTPLAPPDPRPADPQPANKPDKIAFPEELRTKAQMATVRIWNGAKGVDGSGVLIGTKGNFLYILTANHVVDGGIGDLEVSVFSADSFPAPAVVYKRRFVDVVAQSEVGDLALISVATKDRAPSMLVLCSPKQIPEGKDFPALSVGCELKRPIPAEEKVIGKQIIRKVGEEGRQIVFQIERTPTSGRSGGPLVDREGRVIGICSGIGDGKGYYIHPEQIHKFLREKYSWLWENPQQP